MMMSKHLRSSLALICIISLAPMKMWADNSSQANCTDKELESCTEQSSSGHGHLQDLAGPEQVENRLHIDSNAVTPMFPSSFARDYFDWKDRVKEENGVGFGGDYSFAYLSASNSPGADDAFGGMYRLFGTWEATADGKGNSGALIWKVEHRHAYGSNIPPGSLGFETGYIGLHLPPFSDQGMRLTNLYWRQRMKGGKLVFVGGFVDVTDYVDVYILASPWTGYFNFAFSTGSATMAVPNEGWGMALGGYLNDNWYLIGGFADSNSDPTDPIDGLDTFFDEREYFKHVELGWNASVETAFLDNVHLTLWHNDKREAAATPSGWGANLSFSRSWKEHWIPFLRFGYAKDAGTLLERSVVTGLAYQTVPGGNQLGLAYNYGVPNENTWGPGLDKQHTLEAFYRIQLWKEIAITPDIQYIRNPALNPAEKDLWVFGIRARFAF
jgi:porin